MDGAPATIYTGEFNSRSQRVEIIGELVRDKRGGVKMMSDNVMREMI